MGRNPVDLDSENPGTLAALMLNGPQGGAVLYRGAEAWSPPRNGAATDTWKKTTVCDIASHALVEGPGRIARWKGGRWSFIGTGPPEGAARPIHRKSA